VYSVNCETCLYRREHPTDAAAEEDAASHAATYPDHRVNVEREPDDDQDAVV
jgi:hypothetical protein